ncbi:PAS domain-containing protein [Alteromonas facilis]|uniref:PAS domain-containing protein n=1 Tax=Alteromonas facilis TaxID=2048004 RepID=UPI000C290725|nr:PAS domain-containing protein [Alteromonas facilis]
MLNLLALCLTCSMKDYAYSILEILPTATAIIKHIPDSLNHELIYVNPALTALLGWVREDIPDKDAWWKRAYPDPDYQKVVERQWELAMETASASQYKHVMMDVNIMTKFGHVQRCRVYTEQPGTLIPGHYIVAFMPCEAEDCSK